MFNKRERVKNGRWDRLQWKENCVSGWGRFENDGKEEMIEEQSVIKLYLSIKEMTEDSDVPVAHPNPSATF